MSQQDLPGTVPTETRITGKKLIDLMLETGSQAALSVLHGELVEARKQHPGAIGLTYAIALVERSKAEAQLRTTRIVLAQAAKAGIQFDGQVLTSNIEGDAVIVRATPEPPEGARS